MNDTGTINRNEGKKLHFIGGESPVGILYIVFWGLVMLTVSLGAGCSGIGNSSATVYQDEKVRVSREADPSVTSGRSGQNDHPVTLETSQVAMLLKGVEVERQPGLLKSLVSGPTREPAFDEFEIAALAPHLKEAIARVSPEERVSFALSDPGRSELTSGKVWIRGKRFHFVLDRYRAPEGGQQSTIPTPYQSSFNRGPAAAQRVPPDFVVLFSPSRYVIKQEPSVAAQLLANPETQVVIDYQRFFADARQAPDIAVTASSMDERRRPTSSEASTVTQQDSQVNVRALTERIKTLETQVTDLVEIVKKLTVSLEDARKGLAAKDEQIQMLLRANPALQKSKPSLKGRSGDRDKSPAP
ncbi:MAG TPA: hypothetical protein VGJ57_01465 [Nitrospirales bacterium]|jgi:hypothetical protein